MRKLLLIILFLSCYRDAFAQVDSFLIGNTSFRFKQPEGWNLVFLKDSANPQGGNSNVVFRHAAFNDCVYSLIGIEITNRNLKPIDPKKKYRKNKNEESFAEFRTCEDLQLFYYSTSAPNKKKCKNTQYTAAYLHRINDSLDLILYLSSSVTEQDYTIVEQTFSTVVDTFFALNKNTILSLKPWTRKEGSLDSVTFIGRTMNILVPDGWTITKRFEEDPEDPTGKRVAMSPVSYSDEEPKPTLSVSLEEFDMKDLLLSQFIYDFQTNSVKRSPKAATANRFEKIHENIQKNGFDSVYTQRILVGEWNGESVTYFVQRFTVLVDMDDKTYQVDFTMTVSVGDAMELQYMTEMFTELCDDICVKNQFETWK